MGHAIGPRVQPQHLTGNMGESLVRLTFLSAGVPVISVDQGDDYGTDLLVQVPHQGTNQLSGSLVRIQVKCGKAKYHRGDGTGRCQLDAEHRAYYTDGPVPSILITVDPDSEEMHWGNITEQLRGNRSLKVVHAPYPFTREAVPQILKIATQADPGEWALALSNSDPVARKIAIEGCLLTAHQDGRVLDVLRAYTPRLEIGDIAFLATRIREEESKHFGQQSLMDFSHRWGSRLEDMLPAERSYWKRPPYPKELFRHLVDLFKFSRNDLLEIIDRNQEAFEGDTPSLFNGPLQSAACILDLNPSEHAETLMEICLGNMARAAANGRVNCGGYHFLLFVKALELDALQAQRSCEQAEIRVLDIIYAAFHDEPEIAAAMWALWND